ncbi:MAG: hypothetical protein AB1Z98_28005 [Nannocystaceae bacterium]
MANSTMGIGTTKPKTTSPIVRREIRRDIGDPNAIGPGYISTPSRTFLGPDTSWLPTMHVLLLSFHVLGID